MKQGLQEDSSAVAAYNQKAIIDDNTGRVGDFPVHGA